MIELAYRLANNLEVLSSALTSLPEAPLRVVLDGFFRVNAELTVIDSLYWNSESVRICRETWFSQLNCCSTNSSGSNNKRTAARFPIQFFNRKPKSPKHTFPTVANLEEGKHFINSINWGQLVETSWEGRHNLSYEIKNIKLILFESLFKFIAIQQYKLLRKYLKI